VAWSAQQQWHEERFADLYQDDTLAGSRDMSVLFADLQGFTSYSEATAPLR
jgi:class 3 adenylate cyclase